MPAAYFSCGFVLIAMLPSTTVSQPLLISYVLLLHVIFPYLLFKPCTFYLKNEAPIISSYGISYSCLWHLTPHICHLLYHPCMHSLPCSPVVSFSQLVLILTCCTMQTLQLLQRHSLPDKAVATPSQFLLLHAAVPP